MYSDQLTIRCARVRLKERIVGATRVEPLMTSPRSLRRNEPAAGGRHPPSTRSPMGGNFSSLVSTRSTLTRRGSTPSKSESRCRCPHDREGKVDFTKAQRQGHSPKLIFISVRVPVASTVEKSRDTGEFAPQRTRKELQHGTPWKGVCRRRSTR